MNRWGAFPFRIGGLSEKEGLDLGAVISYWSEVSGIPADQFTKPYRAVPDSGIRHNEHEFGCFTAAHCSARVQRAGMGLVRALGSGIVSGPDPG